VLTFSVNSNEGTVAMAMGRVKLDLRNPRRDVEKSLFFVLIVNQSVTQCGRESN